MKSYFAFFITFFLISNSSYAGMFFNKPKEPSNAFDGVYTFSHICFNKKTGEQWPGDMYDGSRFIIKEGKISNNRGGAGRYIIDPESRIDKKGNIYSVQQLTDSLQHPSLQQLLLHSPVLQPSLQQPSAQQVSILSDNSFITELPC